ncbi:hypothetical protein J8I87_11040 [Paraburkholderia sp. LEh10]|uniref:hypothetical protein n=1 Tax=Paraburkholderia sp. LEh10 TaxID=2821353 RepID=UPI001AE48F45|nr:hypothetical protein [Paraburkholderia sp. LEh10]MBP0590238.1 hypothetical protein [Paraburkholderia sp. LEh10]
MKAAKEQSLRYQVEKWLAPTTKRRVHVTHFSRTVSDGRRYVCVSSSHSVNAHVLFFFHHHDGCWRVFPALPNIPQMTVEHCAA